MVGDDPILIELIEMRSKDQPGRISRKLGWHYRRVDMTPWPLLVVAKPGTGTEHFLETERVAAIVRGGVRHEFARGRSAEGAAMAIAELFGDTPRGSGSGDAGVAVHLPIDPADTPKVMIRYLSQTGETTERIIMPLAVEGRFDPVARHLSIKLVCARCELRKAMRSFHIGRILEVADLVSGEVMDTREWAVSLPFDTSDIERGAAQREGAPMLQAQRQMAAGEMERENRMGLWRAIGCAVLLVVFAVFAVVAISR